MSYKVIKKKKTMIMYLYETVHIQLKTYSELTFHYEGQGI